MGEKPRTIRLPADLARAAEALAEPQGLSLDAFAVAVIESQIARARRDQDFRTRLRHVMERDKAILDRLADT
jgi:hypothetical protein